MSGRIDFSLNFGARGAGNAQKRGGGYRVYVLGAFSGRTDVAWEQRKIRPIDIDSFDQVMAQIMPAVELGGGKALSFETLEDFHPDVWMQKISILADLLELKRQLSNPATAEQAAAKIRAFLPPPMESPQAMESPQETGETQEQMLERLLGRRSETPVVEPDAVQRLLQCVVSPHVSKDALPEHQVLISIIDRTVGQYLKVLLHRPDFQCLEALWLATAGLVHEESSDEHGFFLVDIGQDELLNELQSGGGALKNKLSAHIQFGDGEQDVLLVGDYRVADNGDDMELLRLCSLLAKEVEAIFLMAPDRPLVENVILGQANGAQQWVECRKQICSESLVLAYPRYLLRLPYGDKRNPLETLAFDELSGAEQGGELLWGNPAFLCARALIRSGQAQSAEDSLFFGDVPVFTLELGGEQFLRAGAERVLTESQGNALLANGIVPVIAYHQRQGVRLLSHNGRL
ncbi:MAG: type VI secretion system contractile sheath large subunit [Methylomonas sp.]|nr:type VI secretion system contractile sheath large subunit [Methylomonas sp.]